MGGVQGGGVGPCPERPIPLKYGQVHIDVHATARTAMPKAPPPPAKPASAQQTS